MLNRNTCVPARPARGQGERAFEPQSLEDWFESLWRYRGRILISAALALITLAIAGTLQQRVYRSTASLLFGEGLPAQSSGQRMADFGRDQEYLQSVFESPQLLRRVADDPAVKGWTGGRSKEERDAHVEFALRNLLVRIGAGGKVYYLNCDAHDPKLAAIVANTAALKLREADDDLERNAAAVRLAAITDGLRRLHASMGVDTAEVTKDAGEPATEAARVRARYQLSALQHRLSEAQADRIAAEARSATMIAAEPGALDTEPLRASRARAAELKQQLAAAKSMFTSEHYRVRQLEAQLAAAESSAERASQSARKASSSDYLVALGREQAMAAEFVEALAAAAQAPPGPSGDLSRRVYETQRLRAQLDQQLRDADARHSRPSAVVEVVDPAVPSTKPFRPNLVLMGPLAAIVGGLGAALGVLSTTAPRGRLSSGNHRAALDLGCIPHHTGANPDLVMSEDVDSGIADAFRHLRQSIIAFSDARREGAAGGARIGCSVAISGLRMGAGSTFVACNVAISLSALNKSVLLVDANFARPRLWQVFSVPSAPGLADVLAGETGCSTGHCAMPWLTVLPAGILAKDMATDAALAFVQASQAKFDFVVIDAPPAPLSAGKIWAWACDAAILVVPAGAAQDDAASALLPLRTSGASVIGTVTNHAQPARSWRLRIPNRTRTAAAQA